MLVSELQFKCKSVCNLKNMRETFLICSYQMHFFFVVAGENLSFSEFFLLKDKTFQTLPVGNGHLV